MKLSITQLLITTYGMLGLLLNMSPNICFAAAGTEDTRYMNEQTCQPGEPCFFAFDEPGEKKYRKSWKETDDPQQDGWDTEVFNSVAGKQLKKIGKMIVHPEMLDLDLASKVVVNEFSTSGLKVSELEEVFTGENFTVKRQQKSSHVSMSGNYRGKEGFFNALQEIAEPFKGADDLRFKFKLFRVQKNQEMVTTRQYFSISGITEKGVLEQNATWDIHWHQGRDESPLIASITVVEFEEVLGTPGKGKLFRDITESVMHKNESYREQILHGYPEFLSSIENTLEFNVFGTPGLAVGDVNGDGLDDLYVCQEQGLPNLLFLQNQDGSATDVSEKSGTNWLESSRSALLLDLDNDSDQDLIVAMPGAIIIAENDGKAGFEIVASLRVADDPMSMAAADFDNDGDIDFYVTLYNPDRPLEKPAAEVRGSTDATFVYHDANNGPPNVLFRNDTIDGKWQFSDVTTGSGLDINNNRFSLSASWEDYDNDGDQDLYVANDYGRDNLYRNDTQPGDQPEFTDIADEAAVEDSAGSMGITWGDYNRDGYMDAFVSAMWSSAGNRVTYQQHFKPQSPGVKSRLQRFAHGNTMLMNKGDGTFADMSEATGTEMGRWAWSSNFADINNDGWEDVLVANGFLTGDEKGGDL